MSSKSPRGQIVIPILAVLLVSAILFLSFIGWAKRSLWQMRMDLAADAAALSASRAQAEMLNNIAMSNVGINLYIQKAKVPLIKNAIGIMQARMWPAYTHWNRLLRTQIAGFRAFPAGVGAVVSRLNGAVGQALYFPFPMNPYLNPQAIHVGIPLSHPPYFYYRYFSDAYFARAWSPAKINAQPPHKTTWLLARKGIRSIATARLWLDVTPGTFLNNGGFPRERETWLRNLLIQGFYPQFNARLLLKPAISLENFLGLLKRNGRPL